MARAATIDEYIAGFDEPGRITLTQLRALCVQAHPSASEAIKWGHPAYVHEKGTILFMFAGFTHHARLAVTPSVLQEHESDFADAGFKVTKGGVKFPHGASLPGELIVAMLQHRVREFTEHGAKWM